MATAVQLPKTIFITTLPASVSPNATYVQCQPLKIGTKRQYSGLSSPSTPVPLTLASQSSSANSLTSNNGKSGNVWLPATIDRTYKCEPFDDEYLYDSEDQNQYQEDSDQPPRKRERLTHLSPEEKMYRRKLKNRIAAQTARDRKKALMGELEETCRRLEEENDSLVMENSKLRQEHSSLADENEKLKKLLADQQQERNQSASSTCRNQEDVRSVSAFGPAEGAGEVRMGVDLVASIRSNPAVLEILQQLVGCGEIAAGTGAIKRERQLDIGGSVESLPASSDGEIMGHNTIVPNDGIEAAVNDSTAAYVQISSTNDDHQYFNSAFTCPISPASTVLFSSPANDNFDVDSLLQPQSDADLFTVGDTADVQQYFVDDSFSAIQINTTDPHSTTAAFNSNSAVATSPNSVVPTSPNVNFDTDFPALGDDILEEALKSLGDFTQFTTQTTPATAPSVANGQNPSTSEIDFLQNDDFTDLAWEESFAQIFPSLPNM